MSPFGIIFHIRRKIQMKVGHGGRGSPWTSTWLLLKQLCLAKTFDPIFEKSPNCFSSDMRCLLDTWNILIPRKLVFTVTVWDTVYWFTERMFCYWFWLLHTGFTDATEESIQQIVTCWLFPQMIDGNTLIHLVNVFPFGVFPKGFAFISTVLLQGNLIVSCSFFGERALISLMINCHKLSYHWFQKHDFTSYGIVSDIRYYVFVTFLRQVFSDRDSSISSERSSWGKLLKFYNIFALFYGITVFSTVIFTVSS